MYLWIWRKFSLWWFGRAWIAMCDGRTGRIFLKFELGDTFIILCDRVRFHHGQKFYPFYSLMTKMSVLIITP